MSFLSKVGQSFQVLGSSAKAALDLTNALASRNFVDDVTYNQKITKASDSIVNAVDAKRNFWNMPTNSSDPNNPGNVYGTATRTVTTSGNNVSMQSSGDSVGSGLGSTNISPYYADVSLSPLASKYGMDSATAYSEALANTAHQREMEDYKRAGLNPALAVMKGNGSEVISGSQAILDSGGSGGVSGRSSSAKSNYSWIKSLGNVIGSVVSLGNKTVGQSIKGISTGLSELLSSKD